MKNRNEQFVAYCSSCAIKTENRMTEAAAAEWCEMHNEHEVNCEAEPKPVCWVCFEFATHRNQKPPYEYTCDEHAVSIDMVPIEEAQADG